MFSQKTIIKKTVQIGSITLLSRFFGIIREVLMVHYLGVNALSDAFLTAFKIPNSLRKIFAEGALSAAFIPTIVGTIKERGKDAVSGLMTLGFLLFEGFVVILCLVVMAYASHIIHFIAPGFSEQQIADAVHILRIVMPFILFISSSALLAGPLQAVGHFFVPAFSQVLINIVFVVGLLVCLWAQLSITALCWFILLAGLAQFIVHLIAYSRLHFHFGLPTRDDRLLFWRVILKFLLCLPSVSVMEVALFINTSFASYLAPGSLSLLYYANRFVGIPLGVFAVAFSTILLPHFSRINTYSPKRLHFYLLESAKFIFWVTFPVTLLMIFFSHDIFSTIFLSKKFTLAQVDEAAALLTAFVVGLFFFSLNKILLNIFYAMHATWIPAIIALGATLVNVLCNMLFIQHFQAVGLAYSTIISTIIQTIMCIIVLYKKYNFRIYGYPFCAFVVRYCVQVAAIGTLFIAFYYGIEKLILNYASAGVSIFFLEKIGFWLWVAPLSAVFLLFIWYFGVLFKVKIYFLEKT